MTTIDQRAASRDGGKEVPNMTVLDPPRAHPLRTFWDSVQAILSETGIRNREQPDDAAMITGSKVQFPQWLFGFLVLQLCGAIWWAASLQSDVRYLQAENSKLWQKVEVINMEQSDAKAKLGEQIRQKVRETMDDAGYLRVRQ